MSKCWKPREVWAKQLSELLRLTIIFPIINGDKITRGKNCSGERTLKNIWLLLFPLGSANSKIEYDNLEELIYLSLRADFQLFWEQGTLYIVPDFCIMDF